VTAAVADVGLPAGAAARPLCRHCGAPTAGTAFCCGGCAAAHEAIGALGLDAYYRWPGAVAPAQPRDAPSAPDCADFVRREADGTASLDLMVEGLHCAACVWLIETALGRDPDVTAARMNMTTRRLHLAWKGDAAHGTALASLVERLGYRVAPFDAAQLAAADDREGRRLLRALAIAGFGTTNVMMLSVAVWLGEATGMGPATRDLLHWVSAAIALPVLVIGGGPFFRSAWAGLKARRATMDLPIAVGVSITACMSLWQTASSRPEAYFDSACALVFFLLIGRYLDHRARGRARDTVTRLVALQATSVQMLGADGTVSARRASAVPVGAHVLVSAGERIGVDGLVRQGRSWVDASLVTGETTPQAVAAGDRVFAGMLNRDAPLTLEVVASGGRTLLAEIVRMVEAAEGRRGRFVALADRVARRYAPAVHLTALATFTGWMLLSAAGWEVALTNAVAVLIVTCPCALALAVPVAQVVATGRLMRDGILVRSATALERLAEADTILFDKTGTLTEGRPVPRDLEAVPGPILRRAASLAASSRHPLARALAAAVPGAVPAAGVEERPGYGLTDGTARLGSRRFCGVADDGAADAAELWYAEPGTAPVRFAFDDAPRADAAPTVGALAAQGYAVAVLSGDRAPAVDRVAGAVGIAERHAALTPAGKVAAIEATAARGRRVLMVGDGLNDAPALAAAYVSMSPASGMGVTQASADLVFQGMRLAPVATALAVARRTRGIVRANIAFALGYNLVAVPLAIAGLLSPVLAAAAMSGSSLVVILNSLRLGRAERSGP
jgi:Cu2+-exporting ATPase